MIDRQLFPNPREGAVGVFSRAGLGEVVACYWGDSDSVAKKAFGIRIGAYENGN